MLFLVGSIRFLGVGVLMVVGRAFFNRVGVSVGIDNNYFFK